MKHNHYSSVPVAHFDTLSPTRNWRKPLFALLLIMSLTGLGGKAWGQVPQVTWGDPNNPTAYQTIGSNSHVMAFLGYEDGTVITLKGNVELTFPFLVSGNENIRIVSDGNGPHTIKYSGQFIQTFSPFINGFTFNTTDFGAGTLRIDGGSDGIIIQGNNANGLLYIPCITNRSDGTTILNNVTIQDNKCGAGGAINNDGTLTCTDCIFQNNDVGFSGGNFGGAILNNGTLSCTNCRFINNKAFVGGGICSFGKVTATNCTFTSNTASGSGGGNGGGLYQANSSTTNPSVVTSCEFSGNKANAGGAIFSSGYLRITEADNAQTLIHNNEINSGGTGGGGIFTNGIVDMEAGKIYSNSASSNGGGVYVASGATFTMNTGATISTNTATGNTAIGDGGGGVYNAGTFTMNGGEIFSNTANNGANTSGGGVSTSGTFNMFGGTIGKSGSPNRSRYGGGVCVAGGTFTLDGGDIVFNEASNGASSPTWYSGGGVYVGTNATFTLTSGNVGKVVGTTANLNKAKEGGGVYVAGTFNCNGGNVQYNTATTNGGGVYVSNGGLFTLDGGDVIYNTATSGTIANGGGGVNVQAGGTFTFTTGSINNNKASTNNNGSGGGVCMLGTFNWNGGTIHTNTAKNGGGIYLGANFTMPSGCELYSNTATINGGGVYVPAGITFSMTGG